MIFVDTSARFCPVHPHVPGANRLAAPGDAVIPGH